MRFLIIIFSFICFSSIAGDSLTCKNRKFYIEGSFGRGAALLFPSTQRNYQNGYDPYGYSNIDPSNLYGALGGSNSVSFINSGQISFGYKLVNKDCKIRNGVKHFIYLGAGLSNFNYEVYLKIYNSNEFHYTYTYDHKYSPAEFTIKINKLNYSTFFTMGADYKKGFYISNTLGLGISTFIMKKKYFYTDHYTTYGTSSSPDSATVSNPFGYYGYHHEYDIDRAQKNYALSSLYGFYNINLGVRIKNFIPNISAEMNLLNQNFTSVYIFRAGLRILL
jgi:hypothetical protein